ncbi:MAG: twin transmembrane helix small protein [Parvibaculaceae bacterium]|nr:twin transmembrane helix small protein [Parvibaculaceae bacterium]
MNEFFTWAGPIALLAVLAVLILGLWNMMRGGSASRSQTLMRWRVGLQFLALVIIMTGLYFASR